MSIGRAGTRIYTRDVRRGPIVMMALLSVLGASSCRHGSYQKTWQAEEKGGGAFPPTLFAALLLRTSSDIDVINRAGGTLIGWHDTKDTFAMRAGSSGGTHFAAVMVPPPFDHAGCYSWGDNVLCPAPYKARLWRRIAVFRVSPDRWHALPAHLIPTDTDLVGKDVSAFRSGCRGVHPQYGIVRCERGWRVVTNSAFAANVPPVVPTPGGPDVSGPRGPLPGEPDTEPFNEQDGP